LSKLLYRFFNGRLITTLVGEVNDRHQFGTTPVSVISYGKVRVHELYCAPIGADSDDCGRGFRLNAATRSD
jgi:hypothetical protein